MGTPAPSTLSDLTSRVAALEVLVVDHVQKFDTLETVWWKRVLFTVDGWPHHRLNGVQKHRFWHRGR